MAYNPTNLSFVTAVATTAQPDHLKWSYVDTSETRAAMDGSFFAPAVHLIRAGDFLIVEGSDGFRAYYAIDDSMGLHTIASWT